MAASVSPPGKYPGVYVQTLLTPQPPTGGVATSVGAFIGRTPQGPVNVPTTCLSYGDYQRQFGGLSSDSAVSYQASGFFNNGGAQAEIVRLYRLKEAAITAKSASATIAGTFTLTLAPVQSGPTVTVTTGSQYATTAPKVDEVYQALGLALQTQPALAGLIDTVTTSGGLGFNLRYPCTISGGGPGAWSFTLNGGTAATTVAIGTGSSVVSFNASTTFSNIAFTKTAILTLTPQVPIGAASFSIRVGAPGTVDPALAIYYAIMQSPQATSLVTPTNPTATPGTLTLTYAGAVTLALTLDGVSIAIGSVANTPVPAFSLTAANPGQWGNNIVAAVDYAGITPAVAANYGLKATDLFNLTVASPSASERYTAVTLVASAGSNRLDRVLQSQSQLVVLGPSLIGGAPPPNGASGQGAGGQDSDSLQITDYLGNPSLKTGLYALNQNPFGFNILSIPPDDTTDPNGGDVDPAVYEAASQICVDNNAMLIIDPPTKWFDPNNPGDISNIHLTDLGNYTDPQGRACAVYFPRVIIADPLRNGLPRVVVPSGFLAAVWASVDTAVGVWKAPAGLDAPIGGILQLQAKLNNDQNGVLNPQGINALRFFTGAGSVVWGARTLRGADQLADQYKYIPVQRLLDYIETSLLENTRWAVFQPNGEALWSKLQTQITVFMTGLFSQGAFAGTSASQAFFVKCDATTTTLADTVAGIVNVQVGFAPIYPAEFVVITISQITASSG